MSILFFGFPVSDLKCNFIFFNLEFVNWKGNNKTLTIDLVFWSEFLLFNFKLVTPKQNNKIGK